MRFLIYFATVIFCWCPAIAQSNYRLTSDPQLPLQLEMRVPFEPTAFPSAGHQYLMYELHLTNFTTAPFHLSRIEVLDADAPSAAPIASFDPDRLETMVQPLGGKKSVAQKNSELADGGSAIVFVSIAFDRSSQIPKRLLHRVVTSDAATQGAVIATHGTTLHVLAPPVEGASWLAADGPSNDPDSHHRRGILIVDGQATISRRYAVDWKQVTNGASFAGDPRDIRAYYAYGKAVLAVADGRVVTARDGLPENVPGHGEAFHPAVAITMETVAGNTITLDLGGGQFAYYMHLQPGSVRVKAGDQVRRGEELGRVGASGDAREPHLHFEVTNSSKPLAGEGVPYLIDRYFLMTADGKRELHTHELPLKNSIVMFGEDTQK
jgi:murein DD-endopeptidase MepM/ murein hydrolase activator NlpD